MAHITIGDLHEGDYIQKDITDSLSDAFLILKLEPKSSTDILVHYASWSRNNKWANICTFGPYDLNHTFISSPYQVNNSIVLNDPAQLLSLLGKSKFSFPGTPSQVRAPNAIQILATYTAGLSGTPVVISTTQKKNITVGVLHEGECYTDGKENFFIARIEQKYKTSYGVTCTHIQYMAWAVYNSKWNGPHIYDGDLANEFLPTRFSLVNMIPDLPTLQQMMYTAGIVWPGLGVKQAISQAKKQYDKVEGFVQSPQNTMGCECGIWKTGGNHSDWCKCYEKSQKKGEF